MKTKVALRKYITKEEFNKALGIKFDMTGNLFYELKNNGGFIEDDDMFYNHFKLSSNNYDYTAHKDKIMSLVEIIEEEE